MTYTALYFIKGAFRRIEAIIIRGISGEYVTSYRLLFSSDGTSFLCYQEIPGTDKVSNKFPTFCHEKSIRTSI